MLPVVCFGIQGHGQQNQDDPRAQQIFQPETKQWLAWGQGRIDLHGGKGECDWLLNSRLDKGHQLGLSIPDVDAKTSDLLARFEGLSGSKGTIYIIFIF